MHRVLLAVLPILLLAATTAVAGTTHTVVVDGTDAIYLAGRTDVTIPDLGSTHPSFPLLRHGHVGADFEKETFPSSLSVIGGDIVYVTDPAVGWIHFYNGLGSPADSFGPEGFTGATSALSALGGLSGWHGSLGPLAGVFLDASVPDTGPAPSTLDFSTAALRDFTVLTPGLGQVFFIGDGITSGGTHQKFVAPTGATRVFFGIPDGFGFLGGPGAYEDNDGAYTIKVGINQIPAVPLPASASLGLALLGLLAVGRRLRRRE